MVYSINPTMAKSIPLSITQAALRTAQQFARLQPTAQKQQQVYLNTLAVSVVHDYMQMMAIPTDLNKSDSWNQTLRLAADVADLMLPGLGHLECRPVTAQSLDSSTTPICYMPPEVPADRIGIVIVSLEPELQQATLLGFSRTVETTLAISQLQTVDDLLEYLEYLEPKIIQPLEPLGIIVQLSRWLEQQFETGWQSVESLLTTQTSLAWNFRAAVTTVARAKPIDLGSQLMAQSVVLVVKLTPTAAVEIEITVGVQPNNGQTYLPAQLELAVLDELGVLVMVARANSANQNIQLQFSGKREEHFSVKLTLGDVSVSENFVI